MNGKKKLAIVGAHGSGEIAMSLFTEIFQKSKNWDILGYINDCAPVGECYSGHKIVASTKNLRCFLDENKDVFMHYTLHFNAKDKVQRVKCLDQLNISLNRHITGIHPRAFINATSTIGIGTLILPNVATSSNVKIGNCVHIYTNSFIGHDSIISDYSTLAAHSVVGARVLIGEGAHIGLNSTIREDCRVGEYSIVGMGAVVLNDVPPHSIVAGNPARIISKLES